MSNTVITTYTDLNGPSTKADSSVVVIVNKDGSLSVDEKLLGTLMGTDGSQATGISVVRVGHEGKPDDATDSETEDDKVPHVTLSVDSYFNEPNSIIKYDSGADMLQSLRIETRENSLLGFQNDHCYTQLTSPEQDLTQGNDSYSVFGEPVIEITHNAPPKPVSDTQKPTALDQKIIPKGRKTAIDTNEMPVVMKTKDGIHKPLSTKLKQKGAEKKVTKSEDSSSISSSADSVPERDSDSDYKGSDKLDVKTKKVRQKPRILKNQTGKNTKSQQKVTTRLKVNRNTGRKELKEKVKDGNPIVEKVLETPVKEINEEVITGLNDSNKSLVKQTPKIVKKEKKTPAHVSALLSDMTSLFSTPDVIRRVSTDKIQSKIEKDASDISPVKQNDEKVETDKTKNVSSQKISMKQKGLDKANKGYDIMPQLDDASLAQILQDTAIVASNKVQTNIPVSNAMNSPGLTGPLSPTLDLLGGLQPEEEGLTEDLLMHVAQLVESSENLQEVIDKQVLAKIDNTKTVDQSPFQQHSHNPIPDSQISVKTGKTFITRKEPIEVVRRDGRVITLPPIEAPATRASKRKNQTDSVNNPEPTTLNSTLMTNIVSSPEQQVQPALKHYINKKLSNKKDINVNDSVCDKSFVESHESWDSEDDPNRLWCICKQPHNNRFMICCDGCEDWFHGKCVNITKAMGQQMEEQGVEWRCPNCVKKVNNSTPKSEARFPTMPKKIEAQEKNITVANMPVTKSVSQKTICIVCKKSARSSSIYCSDACILKHAQDSLNIQNAPSSRTGIDSGKQEKCRPELRVIVYERKTGKLLAGPNAPTADNLRSWLQKNPTFEVVRPGTLSAIKPNLAPKKSLNEPKRIQTTLNFEQIPKKQPVQENKPKSLDMRISYSKESGNKIISPSKETKNTMPLKEVKTATSSKEIVKNTITLKELKTPPQSAKTIPQIKTPVTPKHQTPSQLQETPKITSTGKSTTEPRKIMRSVSRSVSTQEKIASVSPVTSRKKDTSEKNKMNTSEETVRENVKKALQEQISQRMSETAGYQFSEEEVLEFATETEEELYDLFKDVGMKYKAKYRSLMFNIKDRKNQSLWQKICDRSVTPKQLVRLSPEQLASEELAEWRDQESKHQLELIKKSELDLLAASKTYVLKTHKGEEVMETKEAVSTELDPAVPVEALVTVLNDETTAAEAIKENSQDQEKSSVSNTSDNIDKKNNSIKKRHKDYRKKNIDGNDKKKEHDDSRGSHTFENVSDEKRSRLSRRKSEYTGKKELEYTERKSSTLRSRSNSKEEERSFRISDRKSSRTLSSSEFREKGGLIEPLERKTRSVRSHSHSVEDINKSAKQEERKSNEESSQSDRKEKGEKITRLSERKSSRTKIQSDLNRKEESRVSSQCDSVETVNKSSKKKERSRSKSKERDEKSIKISPESASKETRDSERKTRGQCNSKEKDERKTSSLHSQEKDDKSELLPEQDASITRSRSASIEKGIKFTRRSERTTNSKSSQSESKERDERTIHHYNKKISKERSRSNSNDGSRTKIKDKSDSRHRSRRSRSKEISRKRSRSISKGHEKSLSPPRTRRRSPSHPEENVRQTRSKHNAITGEKLKLRSKSQENILGKNKTGTPDSDTIERPKSAMMKELHPAYDPHEPMITSALSDEDLKKINDDSFRNELDDLDVEYDPLRGFSIDTSTLLPFPKEKITEVESDQEPSSTVENSAVTVWNGCINMVDVARFYVAAHEVSGNAGDLEDDLPAELDVVGRINPDTVWDYINKMKKTSNKDIVILKLQAANDEEKMQYIALYSYLNIRNRLGVVEVSSTSTVKDFYIVPLPANTPLPSVLLPLDAPGLDDVKTHLLLAIVIRQRRKRPAPHIPKEIIPAKVMRESSKRSYTPPVSGKSYTPPSSPRLRPRAATTYTTPSLSTSVKDKIAASLASADDEEAYSPSSTTSGGSAHSQPSSSLQYKMVELNRQIEEQKRQIQKMTQADSSVAEDEAYSPSRPLTPSEPTVVSTLDDIAIPSNLQEILATIKQRETNVAADVDRLSRPL